MVYICILYFVYTYLCIFDKSGSSKIFKRKVMKCMKRSGEENAECNVEGQEVSITNQETDKDRRYFSGNLGQRTALAGLLLVI